MRSNTPRAASFFAARPSAPSTDLRNIPRSPADTTSLSSCSITERTTGSSAPCPALSRSLASLTKSLHGASLLQPDTRRLHASLYHTVDKFPLRREFDLPPARMACPHGRRHSRHNLRVPTPRVPHVDYSRCKH